MTDDESDELDASELRARVQELAQALLLARLGELCLRYGEGATWLPGFERAVWRAVLDGPFLMTEAEVAELDRLSSDAQGWWHVPGDLPSATFMPLEDWQKFYEVMARSELDLASENKALKARLEALETQLARSE